MISGRECRVFGRPRLALAAGPVVGSVTGETLRADLAGALVGGTAAASVPGAGGGALILTGIDTVARTVGGAAIAWRRGKGISWYSLDCGPGPSAATDRRRSAVAVSSPDTVAISSSGRSTT